MVESMKDLRDSIETLEDVVKSQQTRLEAKIEKVSTDLAEFETTESVAVSNIQGEIMGPTEEQLSAAFADQMKNSPEFCSWVLQWTKFSELSSEMILGAHQCPLGCA